MITLGNCITANVSAVFNLIFLSVLFSREGEQLFIFAIGVKEGTIKKKKETGAAQGSQSRRNGAAGGFLPLSKQAVDYVSFCLESILGVLSKKA